MKDANTHNAGQPEWLRVKDACHFSSLTKPKLYDLMNRGLIRSVALREPDQRKGTRLVHRASLHTFLESRASGGSPVGGPVEKGTAGQESRASEEGGITTDGLQSRPLEGGTVTLT